MKCPICNGSGIDNHCDRLSCYECGGSGEVEQTNEEWLKQCTTEELAKVLFDFYLSGYIAKEPPLIDEGVKQAELWLKEVHK